MSVFDISERFSKLTIVLYRRACENAYSWLPQQICWQSAFFKFVLDVKELSELSNLLYLLRYAPNHSLLSGNWVI